MPTSIHRSIAVPALAAGDQHPAAARVQDGGGGALPVAAQPLRRGQGVLGRPRPPRHNLRRHRRPVERGIPRARDRWKSARLDGFRT